MGSLHGRRFESCRCSMVIANPIEEIIDDPRMTANLSITQAAGCRSSYFIGNSIGSSSHDSSSSLQRTSFDEWKALGQSWIESLSLSLSLSRWDNAGIPGIIAGNRVSIRSTGQIIFTRATLVSRLGKSSDCFNFNRFQRVLHGRSNSDFMILNWASVR